MKTLDEVIETLERIFGYISDSTKNDALHYLKKYRDNYEARNDQIERYQKVAKECEEILTDYVALKQYWAEQQENNPLTWDELRAMEGKPVWVEYNFQISDKKFRDNSKRWCVIREFEHWHDTEIIITDNGFVLSKNEQVTDWQAYRKERHELDQKAH